MKKALVFSFALLCGLTAAPAFATVTVGSPGNGADVSSPFTLSANASTCSSQSVAAMGYSFDNSTDTTIVNSTSVNRSVSTGPGAHTLHVKAWGNQGAVCVTDVGITVVNSNESGSIIPPGAQSVSSIESLSNWIAAYDNNSGIGTASGSMNIVSSPSQNGHARQFVTHFSNSGGERYSVTFGDDETASNFMYDGWGVPCRLRQPDRQPGTGHEPDHGERSNGDFWVPMRRLQQHLGFHQKCGYTDETFRPMGALQRLLQPTFLVHEHVASRAGLLFPR
jgi:hypothetical protein